MIYLRLEVCTIRDATALGRDGLRSLHRAESAQVLGMERSENAMGCRVGSIACNSGVSSSGGDVSSVLFVG